ncbi:G-protein coupled receptor 35-like [Physella acuta]|uniref:G-protein coupled receptor 35-like n=1 Tax=Physella acuta TaxID=109671 RepID=UPI0027DC6011|nr:G-protein coupled receptor 35-like [Physella acuta]
MVRINDPRDTLINPELQLVTEIVNYVILGGSLSVFGMISNIINMVVFYKQGLQTTTNISLFALSLADLLTLVTLFEYSIWMNPLVEFSDTPVNTREVQYLITGWPNVCFTRITCLIMAFITAERYINIKYPHKAKQIITPKRTKGLIFIIFVISIIMVMPSYSSIYYDWKFYPRSNVTKIGIHVINNGTVDKYSFLINAMLGLMALFLLIMFTSLIVWQLHLMVRRRSARTSDPLKASSSREKKVVKMVLIIATIQIFCTVPSIAFSFVCLLVDGMTIIGFHQNTFFFIWSFNFVLGGLNSSVNIFLYYKMNSKYKNTLREMFAGCSGLSQPHAQLRSDSIYS